MLTDQSKGIQEFLFDRLFKIHETVLAQDQEYQALQKASAELAKKLSTIVGPELWAQVDKYDCSCTQLMNRQDELVYSQGLLDGIILADWLARVRRDEVTIYEMVSG